MAKRRGGRKSESSKRVSEKISFLRHEGTPQKQAIAESLSMERAGRLGRHGVYHPVGKKGRVDRPLGS